MKPRQGRQPGKPSLIARFASNRRGTTVIEFALLAIPFLLLVFAILESCITFAGQQMLANATDDVARQLRTGQVKAADLTKDKLHDLLCAKLQIMVGKDCPGLYFDLKSYSDFKQAALIRTHYTGDHDLDTTGFAVTPGLSMSKNMLRVFYKWPIITDYMRYSMSNLKGHKTLLFASVTWQNEPFDD